MPQERWAIPPANQPDPDSYAFDLDTALTAVVGLRAYVPADAFTAGTLGTERTGNGVVIRDDGVVLTIGYLTTEAEQVWLTTHDGRAIAATPLAIDPASGLGLVQALGRLGVPALELGQSDGLTAGTRAIMAAAGGRAHALETRVVSRQEFAGYWEYLLDNAIFTAPAHPFWSGSALIGHDGRLMGTGSLILQQGKAEGHGERADLNMVVPASCLAPVLDDMLAGGPRGRPPRPWLGLYAMENDGHLVVGGLAERGPAAAAGVQQGDRIVALGEERVRSLGSLWRKLWASGPPGSAVALRLDRDGESLTVRITSSERGRFLRAPRLH